ncbi:MAG: class I SAM-dependent methyltransferase [Bacteroidota bacterium]
MAVPWTTYWHHIRSFARYYSEAVTRYDVHSPFLSVWVERVLEDQREFYAFDDAERIRLHWLHTQQFVDYSVDHGAGSRAGQGKKRSVREIVEKSAIEAQAGRWLFRMVDFHQPNTILELGTNLGISALYLQGARRSAHLITIEGNPEVAKLARQSFRRLSRRIPDMRTGTFMEEIPKIVKSLDQLDFVWMDGDHQYESTTLYFEQLLPRLHERSVVVIGDIHWSEEMELAWLEIRRHPRVTMSVDLYHMGVLFFRPELQQQEHFVLIPYRYKPWRLGFF